MTLEEVKKSVDAGLNVYWRNDQYRVFKNSGGQYLIGYDVGGDREYIFPLEGNPSDFFGAKVR